MSAISALSFDAEPGILEDCHGVGEAKHDFVESSEAGGED